MEIRRPPNSLSDTPHAGTLVTRSARCVNGDLAEPCEGSTRLVEGQTRPPRQRRLSALKDHERDVAHVDNDRASAVRADRRRTVSGDVRRDSRIWLSHADSVGRCQLGSGYRVGLQVGGRGFESRTLHLEKRLIYGTFASGGANVDNAGASAVRADPPVAVRRRRTWSSDDDVSGPVE